MKFKFIFFCTLAAIVAMVYWACKKEQPVVSPSAKTAQLAEANFNSTMTVKEFEFALNTELNRSAIKENPSDPAVRGLESIGCTFACEIKFRSDCVPEILKVEQNKVYNAIRKQANDAMVAKYGNQNGRILAFAVKEITGIPECAVNTTKEVQVMVDALIGEKTSNLGICGFTQTLEWCVTGGGTGGGGGNPNNDAENIIELQLNNFTCNPFLKPNSCPPFGVPIGTLPPFYILQESCGLLGGWVTLCPIWEVPSAIGISYLTPAEQLAAFNKAIDFANSNTPDCGCTTPIPSKIVKYDVECVEIEIFPGSTQMYRALNIKVYYRCCTDPCF